MPTIEPIHPGEHLAEMLDELGVTQYRLAKTIGVPQVRVQQIVHGQRAVTPDSALRLGRALGMTPEFWLNLQRMYDLDVARATTDLSGIGTLSGQGAAPRPLRPAGRPGARTPAPPTSPARRRPPPSPIPGPTSPTARAGRAGSGRW